MRDAQPERDIREVEGKFGVEVAVRASALPLQLGTGSSIINVTTTPPSLHPPLYSDATTFSPPSSLSFISLYL